ncbi:GNAT family N-acetyltransferase [Dyadobacter sp. LJ53]|uniref:GNAT family N-acetyltransferase n=1 Tax=Dyadobacter chenwenxiniae TaxID=2906456 RepID=UPI001F2398C7|nr:GNAT family N-acetyltransferase [Dyadobacter chenwenxiniae]MCF0052835.1 GNAT family N-acetyltransferase [Dyadobacter chenwenxiniae]
MLFVNFDPFPSLETDRLLLHCMSEGHTPDMFRLRSNPLAMQYIGKPLLASENEARDLIDAYNRNLKEKIGITWGISLMNMETRKSEGALIGTIGFHKMDLYNHRAEIGYMIHPDHWAKGIMSEAIKRIIDYGFKDMHFHSIEAKISPENDASRKILLKHGFEKEAYFKESFYENGRFLDTEIYSLLDKTA